MQFTNMKKLLDTQTQQVLSYPRPDNLPIQGLDTARYKVLTVVDTAPPDFNPDTQWLSFSYQVFEDVLEYRQVWAVNEKPLVPNWDGFMADCDDVFATGLQANYLVFTQIFNILLALRAKGSDFEQSPEWRNFAFNYQIGKESLTPEQIAQVESAMTNNNIPVITQ